MSAEWRCMVVFLSRLWAGRSPPGCGDGSGGRGSVLLGLLVSLLLVHDPGVGQVEELGHRQQVVEAQAVGFLPGLIALLVAAGGIDAVPVALYAVTAPDGDLQDAHADFVCGFRHDDLLLLSCRHRSSGPYGTPKEPASDGSVSARSSERPKDSACGKRP